MSLESIASIVEEEIERLTQVRSVLLGPSQRGSHDLPVSLLAYAVPADPATPSESRKGTMSAEARARIGAATKARWAAKRREKNKAK